MENAATGRYTWVTTRPEQRFLPSIEGIIAISIFLMVLILGNHILRDPDTAWHIRTGDYILSQMTVPTTDIFSHRKFGQPWIAHEWLSDVMFAAIYRVAGLNGVVVFSAYVIAVTFVLLFRLIESYRCNILITSSVTILSAVTTSIHWLARPHLLSFCMLVIWYAALESHQRAPKRYHLILFPGVTILWANLHGSFLLGFVLLGIYGLGNFLHQFISNADSQAYQRKFFSLSAIGIASILASLVNPYGYRLLLFPLEILSANQAMGTISEWLSPNFHRFGSFEFYLLLVVVIFMTVKKKTTFIEAGVVLFSIHISLVAARYIPLFAILMAPVLARRLDDLYQTFVLHPSSLRMFQAIQRRVVESVERFQSFNLKLRSKLFPFALATVVTAAALNGGRVFGQNLLAYEFRGGNYPIRAVEFLKKNPMPGNMFNYYSYGGYLIYAFFPDPRYRVYVDGRAVVGGADYFTDYLDVIYLSPRWKEFLQRDQVNWVLYPANEGFSVALLNSAAWKLIYTDGEASIFIKNIPQNRSIIDKFSTLTSG
jgi:hypothetical protein